jgi:hypothetical protein
MYLPVYFHAYVLVYLFIIFSLISLVYYLVCFVRCPTQIGNRALHLLPVSIGLLYHYNPPNLKPRFLGPQVFTAELKF